MAQETVSTTSSFSLNRQSVGVAILLIIAVAAGVLWLLQQRTVIRPYMIADDRVQLEITQTTKQRERGLSGRTSLGDADGLLFIFPEVDRHGIWMKEMLFPIDIIWVADQKIVDIAPRVPLPPPGTPESELTVYYPRAAANWVIEVPAGTAERRGWKIGDLVVATQYTTLSK